MTTVPPSSRQSASRITASPPTASIASLIGPALGGADPLGEIVAVDHHHIGADRLERRDQRGRRTTLTVRMPRALASLIRLVPTPELAASWITQSPGCSRT